MFVRCWFYARATWRRGGPAGLLLLLVPTAVMSQSGGAYRLSSYTIASGGGSATGGLLSLLASAGQPVAGQAAAGAYTLTAGFWDPHAAGPVGIDDIAGAPLPLAIRLATPNPTAGPSTIVLDLPAVRRLALSVYNVSGRLVRSLESAPLPPGQHRLAWDGRDEAGLNVPAGLYLVRLRTDLGNRTEKLVVLR